MWSVFLREVAVRGGCRAGTGRGACGGSAEAHPPPAFQLCVMSLCSSSYSAWGLQLITDLLALRSSSYWLVRTELLETVAEIDFRWVRQARWGRLEWHGTAWCPGAGSDLCPSVSAPPFRDFALVLEFLRPGRGVEFAGSLSRSSVLYGVSERAQASKTMKLVSLGPF